MDYKRTIVYEEPVFLLVPQKVALYVTDGFTPYRFKLMWLKRVIECCYSDSNGEMGIYYRVMK